MDRLVDLYGGKPRELETKPPPPNLIVIFEDATPPGSSTHGIPTHITPQPDDLVVEFTDTGDPNT